MTQEQAGLPVRLKIGETGNDVQILADKDGEQIDLCDILPIARLTLNVEGPHAYTAVAVELELEAVEADVERAQLRFSESDLRWLAKAHGKALVPVSNQGLFKVHITCADCGHVTTHRVVGTVHALRCGACGWTHSVTMFVDGEGWARVKVEPDTYAEVEPIRVSDD